MSATPEQRERWRKDAMGLHLGMSVHTSADRILWLCDALDAAEAAIARVVAQIEEAERGGGIVITPGFTTYYSVETGLLRAALADSLA